MKKGLVIASSLLFGLLLMGAMPHDVEAYAGGLHQAYLPAATHGTWQYKFKNSHDIVRVVIKSKKYVYISTDFGKKDNVYIRTRVSQFKHSSKYSYRLYSTRSDSADLKWTNHKLYIQIGGGPGSTHRYTKIKG